MGWFSTLAKIGGAAAAPFTGGASLALSALGAVGDVAGKAAGAAGQGRLDEAQLNVLRDRNALDAYQAGLALPKIRTADAVRGALLSNLQDVGVSQANPRANIVSFTGGLRPSSAITPTMRTMGQDITRRSVLDQLNGAGPPALTPLPEASWVEKLGSGAGVGGSIFGALGGLNDNNATTGAVLPSTSPAVKKILSGSPTLY